MLDDVLTVRTAPCEYHKQFAAKSEIDGKYQLHIVQPLERNWAYASSLCVLEDRKTLGKFDRMCEDFIRSGEFIECLKVNSVTLSVLLGVEYNAA